MRTINDITVASHDADGNKVLYSNVSHYSNEGHVTEAVINYVITGLETYHLNKERQDVYGGQYVLINKAQFFELSVVSPSPVKGFAIYLNEELLSEVARNLRQTDEQLLHNPFEQAKPTFEFVEATYSNDSLLPYLRILEKELSTENGLSAIAPDWLYYTFARELLLSQEVVSRSVLNIHATRPGTRKELFKRVLLAKQILDDSSENKDIAAIASAVALSEFHFFRTFRQAFGVSPHQYQIQRKLTAAAKLLQQQGLSVAGVAYSTGFGDIFNFSKAFKKLYSVSPLQYQKKFSRI